MKKFFACLTLLLSILGNVYSQKPSDNKGLVRVEGQDLVTPDGDKFFIKGINLGNWLNPEGYMIQFGKTANSYRLIDEALKEMVGEAYIDQFWRDFQEYYITRDDIRYIRQTGMNTVRVPFHYKMLTNQPFMGYSSKENGYAVIDQVIEWCRQEGLYVILDMHVAPGGQTGMNIDDSYGYPWLLVNNDHKQEFYDLWKEIAKRYRKNKTVLAYDLLNEPIASSFFRQDTAMLNPRLDTLLKAATEAVREVDQNHIIIVSGSMWGQDYSIFTDWWKKDKNLMFTCHRYHCDSTETGISDFLAYRDKFDRPFYMGETGHEPDEWIKAFCETLERVNIGWTYWPYKKMGNATSMVNIPAPANWDLVLAYVNSDRSSFESIRENRPDQELVRRTLHEFIQNIKFENCRKNQGYIRALGMTP